jgi:hypothetical protein
VEKPPTLDGRLTEACWQGEAPIRDFVVLGDNRPANPQTRAWVAYDSDHLYVAIRADEPQMDRLAATVREPEEAIFRDDVLEIFLDPGRSGFNFLQFAFNALGTPCDVAGDAAGSSSDWNGQWSVKTARGADHWSAEVALPFATLGLQRGVGPVWGLNIARERPANKENSCWSQTGPRFAVPAAFGTLTLAADFAPFLLDLTVTDWGQAISGANSLRWTLTNPGPGGLELAATLQVQSPDEAPRVQQQDLAPVAAAQTRSATMPYQFFQHGLHRLLLTVRQRGSGRLLAAVGRNLPVAPLADLMVFKSQYRPDVALRYRLNIPPERLGQMRLTVTLQPLEQPQTLSEQRLAPPPALEGEVRFDTASLAAGQYRLHCALSEGEGPAQLKETLVFPVLRPAGAVQPLVTMREDNMLVVEGRPFFPLGIYEAPATDHHLGQLAAAGFNLCRLTAAPAGLPKALERFRQQGMRAWFVVGNLMELSTDAAMKRQRLGELVKAAGDDATLLLWESIDEPAWGGANAEGLYEGYVALRTLDPRRPVWTNHAPRNLISTLAYYNRATDLGGVDIYPVPEPQTQSNLPNKTLSVVADETVKNLQAVNHEKPIFMVLQGFGWGELQQRKGQQVEAVLPTFAQSRFMAYDAIVRGANGLLWWGTHYTRKPSPFFSELKMLVSELSRLQEVLAAPAYPGEDQARLTSDTPAVQYLHKLQQGRNTLLIVNESAAEVTATFKAPTVFAPRLRRLFEGSEVTLRPDQTFSLSLQPYGVAVLSDDKAFADVRTDFTAEWRDAPPEQSAGSLYEPGNLIGNPGFEIDRNGDEVPDGWGGNITFSLRRSPTAARSGKYGLALSSPGTDLAPLVVHRNLNLQADQRYLLSAWAKAPGPEVEYRIYVEWVRDGKFNSRVGAWAKGNGQWQQTTLTFEATPDPQGQAYVVVQMRGPGTVYFDDLHLELAPQP